MRRLKACVEAWPECETGLYDPRCCRFPKSCSCTVYYEESTSEDDLELEPAGFTEFRGVPDCDANMTCTDCDWRIRIVGPDEAAVRRALTVTFSDHHRAYHAGPLGLGGDA